MKGRINLFWFKYNKGSGNYGDELNPYLIKRLSGLEIEFYNIKDNIQLYSFKKKIRKLIFSKDRLNILLKIVKSKFSKTKPIILAIGSVVGWYRIKNIIVWGSGIMSRNETIYPAEFRAVRGKYTQKRLEELGYKAPKVIGDPALLLPLVYPIEKRSTFELGIIPHCIHYDLLNGQNKNPRIKIINLLDSIEKVTDDINSCKLTLSTSLHGIIVSHAYGVPSRWVSFDETSKKELSGDNIKFWDYFSSVNLPEMEAFEMGAAKNQDIIQKAIDEFTQNPKAFLPKAERIKSIRNDLLSVAPFPIKKQYKNDN